MSKITVTIEATSGEDFRAVLRELLGGMSLGDAAPKASSPPKQVAMTIQQPDVAETPNAAADTKPDPMAKARAAKAAKEKAKAEAEVAKPAEPAAAPVAATTNGHAKKAEPAAAEDEGAVAVELPDTIRGTNSMRDLLTFLSEHGVPDIDAMVATCKSLKSVVPILSKVPDIDTRVRRAVEVLGLYAPAEAAAE